MADLAGMEERPTSPSSPPPPPPPPLPAPLAGMSEAVSRRGSANAAGGSGSSERPPAQGVSALLALQARPANSRGHSRAASQIAAGENPLPKQLPAQQANSSSHAPHLTTNRTASSSISTSSPGVAPVATPTVAPMRSPPVSAPGVLLQPSTGSPAEAPLPSDSAYADEWHEDSALDLNVEGQYLVDDEETTGLTQRLNEDDVPVLNASHTAALNESLLSELDLSSYMDRNAAGSTVHQPADEWIRFRQQQDALHQREQAIATGNTSWQVLPVASHAPALLPSVPAARAMAYPSREEMALIAEERRFANLEQQRRLLRQALVPHPVVAPAPAPALSVSHSAALPFLDRGVLDEVVQQQHAQLELAQQQQRQLELQQAQLELLQHQQQRQQEELEQKEHQLRVYKQQRQRELDQHADSRRSSQSRPAGSSFLDERTDHLQERTVRASYRADHASDRERDYGPGWERERNRRRQQHDDVEELLEQQRTRSRSPSPLPPHRAQQQRRRGSRSPSPEHLPPSSNSHARAAPPSPSMPVAPAPRAISPVPPQRPSSPPSPPLPALAKAMGLAVAPPARGIPSRKVGSTSGGSIGAAAFAESVPPKPLVDRPTSPVDPPPDVATLRGQIDRLVADAARQAAREHALQREVAARDRALEGEREKLSTVQAKLSLSEDRVHELTSELDKIKSALQAAEGRAAAAIENAARLKQVVADAVAKADSERERGLRSHRLVQQLSRRVGQLTQCSAEEVLAHLDDPSHRSNRAVALSSANAISPPAAPAVPSTTQTQPSAAARRQAQYESQLRFEDPVDTRSLRSSHENRASHAPHPTNRSPVGGSEANYDERPIRSAHAQQQQSHSQPSYHRSHTRQDSMRSSRGSFTAHGEPEEFPAPAQRQHSRQQSYEQQQQTPPPPSHHPSTSYREPNVAPSRGNSKPPASFLPDSFASAQHHDDEDERYHQPRTERGRYEDHSPSPLSVASARRFPADEQQAAPRRPVPPFAHHDRRPSSRFDEQAREEEYDEEAELDAMIARELQQREQLEREMAARVPLQPVSSGGLPRTPPRSVPPWSPGHPGSNDTVRSSVHLTQNNRSVRSCYRAEQDDRRFSVLSFAGLCVRVVRVCSSNGPGSAPWATSVRSNGQLSLEAQVANAEEQLSQLLKHKELLETALARASRPGAAFDVSVLPSSLAAQIGGTGARSRHAMLREGEAALVQLDNNIQSSKAQLRRLHAQNNTG